MALSRWDRTDLLLENSGRLRRKIAINLPLPLSENTETFTSAKLRTINLLLPICSLQQRQTAEESRQRKMVESKLKSEEKEQDVQHSMKMERLHNKSHDNRNGYWEGKVRTVAQPMTKEDEISSRSLLGSRMLKNENPQNYFFRNQFPFAWSRDDDDDGGE